MGWVWMCYIYWNTLNVVQCRWNLTSMVNIHFMLNVLLCATTTPHSAISSHVLDETIFHIMIINLHWKSIDFCSRCHTLFLVDFIDMSDFKLLFEWIDIRLLSTYRLTECQFDTEWICFIVVLLFHFIFAAKPKNTGIILICLLSFYFFYFICDVQCHINLVSKYHA